MFKMVIRLEEVFKTVITKLIYDNAILMVRVITGGGCQTSFGIHTL